jgi:lysophospholipase L1-like esterase
MKTIKYFILSALALGFMACENEELDELRANNNTDSPVLPELTAGSVDFSNYVSIGPSFTAGITDNSLFIAAQENSFPNILANTFANAGGGEFIQPMMDDNYGGLLNDGERIIGPRLVFGGAGPVPLEAVVGPVMIETDITDNPTGPFNNLGVPGAQSADFITPGYGNIANLGAGANAYAVRMTGNTPNATILELAEAQNPTFFTADLIGGNDVLGYATQGADANISAITPPADFASNFNTIIDGLTANGAKGAVTNIPYVSNLPYFTTVGHDVIPLDATTADLLNSAQAYGAYNAGVAQVLGLLVQAGQIPQDIADAELAKRTITFSAAPNNAVVILDENLIDLSGFNPALISMRQATAEDLVTLPAAGFIGTEAQPGNPLSINGVGVPLADRWILTPEEVQEINAAVDTYNVTIQDVANAKGLAFVDVNQILIDAATTGIVFDGYSLNADLVFGGLVSLDGIHLTARGYAYMANGFLEAIDDTYGSNFEASGNLAKAGDFPTNYSPSLENPQD